MIGEKMYEDIYIGVDGGGTKTKVLISDSTGNIIGEGLGGPSNIRLSVSQAWESINKAVDSALFNAEIEGNNIKSCKLHAGMGLAGYSVRDARETFLATPHRFETLVLETDAYTMCLGAHNGKDGEIIITGTGVIAYQIKGDKTTKIGGWGFPHGDEGGGAWLGLEASRLTMKWLDGRIERTPLLEAVYKHFNNNQVRFITWANRSSSTEFATVAPIVIEHLNENDSNAVKLIKRAAEEVADLKKTLSLKSNQPISLPCHIFGGISKFIYPYLSNKSDVSLGKDQDAAAKGAILMVKKRLQELAVL